MRHLQYRFRDIRTILSRHGVEQWSPRYVMVDATVVTVAFTLDSVTVTIMDR